MSVSLNIQKKIMLLVKSTLRYLEFKAHKEILFKCFLCQFFSAYSYTSMLSLWRNNFIFEKSTYFPAIPDNSQDFWGHGSSRSVVFYEIILWHHRYDHVSPFTCYRSCPLAPRWIKRQKKYSELHCFIVVCNINKRKV